MLDTTHQVRFVRGGLVVQLQPTPLSSSTLVQNPVVNLLLELTPPPALGSAINGSPDPALAPPLSRPQLIDGSAVGANGVLTGVVDDLLAKCDVSRTTLPGHSSPRKSSPAREQR